MSEASAMTNILEIVIDDFSAAIKSTYPDFTLLKGMFGGGGKHGDYKCMAAMPISQVSSMSLCELQIAMYTQQL